MEEKLIECINSSLSSHLYHNAIFFAERLHSQMNHSESLRILADTLQRSGKTTETYHLLKKESLKGNLSGECRFLLAFACFELGKLNEARESLLPIKENDPTVPNGASGLFLLGQIYKKTFQNEKAIDCFKKSLDLNPFLWSSYEALCHMGEDLDPQQIYGDVELLLEQSLAGVNLMTSSNYLETTSEFSPSFSKFSLMTPFSMQSTPVHQHHPQLSSHLGLPTPIAFQMDSIIHSPSTPNNVPFITPSVNQQGNAKQKGRKSGIGGEESLPKRKVLFHTPESVDKKISTRSSLATEKKGAISSVGKLAQVATKKKTNAKSSKTEIASIVRQTQMEENKENKTLFTPLGIPIFDDSIMSKRMSIGDASQAPMDAISSLSVLTLLKTLANGVRHLEFFRCEEAIEEFKKLSDRQYQSAWVLSQVANALFQLTEYKQAKEVFEEVRRMEPWRVAGMEIYSTILWHSRSGSELSHLANSLFEINPSAPESLCVLGNCLSLHGDHEQAIKSFQKAIKINPDFAYAHTLCGHEYLASDDLDRAMSCFRNAARIDDRHYNAWYGMGTVYMKQQKHDQAEYHFKKAISIHGVSSVLHCYLGIALFNNKKYEEALEVFDLVRNLDPSNSLARYKRACALSWLERYEEALDECEELRQSSPKEAQIYFLMGQICRKMNDIEQALNYLMTAQDFADSKGVAYIKSAIDKLHVADLEDEDYELNT